MQKLINKGYFISFALLPIYAFPSGSMQFSHMLLLLTSLVYLFSIYEESDSYKFAVRTVEGLSQLKIYILQRFRSPKLKTRFSTASLLFSFVLYVFFREVMAFSLELNMQCLLAAAYMFYNFIIFATVKSWISLSPDSSEVLKNGFTSAIAVTVLGLFVFGFKIYEESAGGRAVSTFNNPNQLGYFSICILSISAILFFESVVSRFEFFILVSFCTFIAIASLSKAAMVSIGLPLIVLPLIFIQQARNKKLALIVTTLILIIVATYLFQNPSYLEKYAFYHRLAGIGAQSDDSLAGRGYNVAFEIGTLESIFGCGSERAGFIFGNEIHSTLGSVLINYGIVGFSLFASFLIFWIIEIFKRFGFLGLCMVVIPPMAYGLTHNGVRFTLFWLLLALSFSNKKVKAHTA